MARKRTNEPRIVKYYTAGGGRVAGCLLESGVLRRIVIGSRHLMRNPVGWSLGEETIREAISDGVRTIQVLDRETGAEFWAALSDFVRLGVQFERGYGRQICLPIRYWARSRGEIANHAEEAAVHGRSPFKAERQQLQLFAGESEDPLKESWQGSFSGQGKATTQNGSPNHILPKGGDK